jgi:hypothetical protein
MVVKAATTTAMAIKVTAIRHSGQFTADRRAKKPVIRAGTTTAAKRRPIASPPEGPGGPKAANSATIATKKTMAAHAKALVKGRLVGPFLFSFRSWSFPLASVTDHKSASWRNQS